MSTNSECLFIQIKPDQWYYILEGSFAPKNAFDWREYADAYGPFATEDEANDHLADNHANPGGSCTDELPEGITERDLSQDDVLRRLIESAPKNTRPAQHSTRTLYGYRR